MNSKFERFPVLHLNFNSENVKEVSYLSGENIRQSQYLDALPLLREMGINPTLLELMNTNFIFSDTFCQKQFFKELGDWALKNLSVNNQLLLREIDKIKNEILEVFERTQILLYY